jgi:hypothetical protein
VVYAWSPDRQKKINFLERWQKETSRKKTPRGTLLVEMLLWSEAKPTKILVFSWQIATQKLYFTFQKVRFFIIKVPSSIIYLNVKNENNNSIEIDVH